MTTRLQGWDRKTRRCPKCQLDHPVTEYRESSPYCNPCNAIWAHQRYLQRIATRERGTCLLCHRPGWHQISVPVEDRRCAYCRRSEKSDLRCGLCDELIGDAEYHDEERPSGPRGEMKSERIHKSCWDARIVTDFNEEWRSLTGSSAAMMAATGEPDTWENW